MEKDLYSDIAGWLRRFLRERHKGWQVLAEDTSRISLGEFLGRHRLNQRLKWAEILDIKVDVAGVAWPKSGAEICLAIVEVKKGPIRLRDLSQALGYSRVAQPTYAFLISPAGWSGNIDRLIRHFRRVDVLEYDKGRYLVIARWDKESKQVRPGDALLSNLFPAW